MPEFHLPGLAEPAPAATAGATRRAPRTAAARRRRRRRVAGSGAARRSARAYVQRVTGLKLDAAVARLKRRGCRRRPCCARTPRWPWAARSTASRTTRRRGAHAARAVGRHAPRADGGGGAAGRRRREALSDSRVSFRRLTPAQIRATSPAASPWARPAPMRCRAGRRCTSAASTAATVASWACRCTKRRSCCAPFGFRL
jgi:hypothetical protein